MTCERCHGYLLREYLHRTTRWLWRCYNCGERVDQRILLNRAEQDASAAARRETEQQTFKEWTRWLARLPA